jgi:hypothetical protein
MYLAIPITHPRVQAHPPQRQGLLSKQFIICHLNKNPKIAMSANDIHTVRWKMSANLDPPLLFGAGVVDGVGTYEKADVGDADTDEDIEGDNIDGTRKVADRIDEADVEAVVINVVADTLESDGFVVVQG